MFPHRLKLFRESFNLTQQELAKKLNLTQSTIAYYENGKKMPTLENAKVIAEFFNTSLDYLLGISESNNKIIKSEEIYSHTDELNELLINARRLSNEQLLKLTEFIKSIT